MCIEDDVIIHGATQQEHGTHLHGFLAWCQDRGIMLNSKKFEIGLSEVTFMGHKVTKDGPQSDPERASYC